MPPPAWVADAEALMEAAVDTDWSNQGAMRTVHHRIVEFWQEHGEENLLQAMRTWVDHARQETGFEPKDAAAKPSFVPYDADGNLVSRNAIPAGQLWAALFVAARFGRDVDEQQDLLDQLRSPQLSNEDSSAAILHTLRLTSELVRTGQGMRDRPSSEPAWEAQADALFDAAVQNRWHGDNGVKVLLERFAAEHGTPAIIGSMKAWCHRARDLVAANRDQPAFPAWKSETGSELSADDVPAGPRWAGRFVAAMWNDDAEQTQALLGSIRTSDQLTVNWIETLKATTGLASGRG